MGTIDTDMNLEREKLEIIKCKAKPVKAEIVKATAHDMGSSFRWYSRLGVTNNND